MAVSEMGREEGEGEMAREGGRKGGGGDTMDSLSMFSHVNIIPH